jgi:hypothetical protein
MEMPLKKPVRAIWSASFFLALALSLTGCISVEQTISLNADGSGVIELTYGMSQENIARIQDMTASESNGPAATPLTFSEEEIRKDFEAYKPFGVALKSVKTEERGAWKYRTLDISFANLAGLAKTEFVSDRYMSLAKDAQGNYVFTQSATADEGKVEAGGAASQTEPALTNLMKGFKAVMRVKAPGKILDTNAPEKTEDTATWTYDLDKDPQALDKVQRASMRLVFAGQGLTIPEFRAGASSSR